MRGKTQKYDKEMFNNFDLFNKPKELKKFKAYSIQDSKALADALIITQLTTYTKYNVDITHCLSASSLAMRIFRRKFQEFPIPVLKIWEDAFVRESYFGGATDFYNAFVKNVHYLDVNSLYHFSMLKDMPFVLLETITDQNKLAKIDLREFFDFVKVCVICPKNVQRPMLPCRFEGKTIFPTGVWIGTYFSEEIKAVMDLNLGYKFELLEAHSYSKAQIFKSFVEYFYNIKKEALGDERYLAKFCLNSLYGMFGRKR